jgi:hypothetical protein
VNKMASMIENYSKFEVCSDQIFAGSRSESEQDSSQVRECLWPDRSQPKGSVCGATNLKMAE